MSEAIMTQKTPYHAELTAGETYYYCSCGKSASQPFCDGAHKGGDFTPIEFTAEKTETHYLCACRKNDGSPFCDGAHKAL